MRKLLLSLTMLMAGAMAVWAQESAPVPVVSVAGIGTTTYQLSDKDAAKIFELDDLTIVLDVTTDASLSDRGAFFCVADPAQPVPSSFSGTNTSYMACGHVNAGMAYLAAAKDGQHFSTGTIPANSTIRLAYVFDKTNNKFKSYIDNTNTQWTMDRSFGTYEIATPKMVKEDFENAKIYIGGGMANNAAHEDGDATIHAVRVFNGTLTVEQIKALETISFTYADSYENITNWYFIQMHSNNKKYLEYVDNYIEWADATPSVGNRDAYAWAFVGDPTNGFKLVNKKAGSTLAVKSTNSGNPTLASDGTVFKVAASQATGVGYFCMQHPEGNYLNAQNGKVAHWGEPDAGSTMLVSVYQEYSVEDYIIALNALIGETETFISTHTANVNTVGYYTQEALDNLSAAVEDAKEYKESKNFDEVDAAYKALMEAKVDLAVNLPQAGKFYRIMNEGGSGYLDSETGTGRTQFTAGIGEKASSIFYYTGKKLVSYTTGFYLANVNNFVHYTETVGEAAGTTFSFSKSPVLGKLYIKFNNGNRSFYSAGTGDSNAGSNGTGANYRFTISEVTWLPVEINPEVGYATLFSPVQLGFNNRVIAYTGTKGEGWLTLNEQKVVPANTGVLLTFESDVEVETENKKKYVYLPVQATNVTEVKSDLTGFTETKATFGNPYTLQRHDFDGDGAKESVAFKKFTDTNFTGFKAYLDPTDTGASAIGIRFEDGTTGIDHSELTIQNSELIFDLMGRRVETMTVGNIYIVNGKKVVIK